MHEKASLIFRIIRRDGHRMSREGRPFIDLAVAGIEKCREREQTDKTCVWGQGGKDEVAKI